jgi:hypothetical protein
MKRTLAIAALLTITGGGTYALANSHPAANRYDPPRIVTSSPVVELEPNACPPECDTYPTDAPAPTCHEDEPCWSCSTMGNLICGPIPAMTNETVAPRSGRAVAPTDPAITTLPDGNLTAIAQGPPAVPNTNPSSAPATSAPTVSGASEGESTAPVVWEWRSPTRENGWTQSAVGATGCWSAYGINGRPMERQAPNEVNQTNWEIMRRSGARSIDCSSADVQAGWDPTVALVVE